MSTFQRFDVIGTTPHRHEREGLEWLRAALPTYEPHGAVALFSFQTDDGRRYEIDAVALTSHALYVVELKSWRGRVVEGDARHLVTYSRERGREFVDHPLPLLETKTKAFMAKVRRVARQFRQSDVIEAMDRLWAEPLVWLTHAEGSALGKHDAASSHLVVGRAEINDAIRQASFPGARDDLKARSIPRDTLKILRRVLSASEFGLGKIDKPLTVLDGRFDLAELVEEGDDYQDHWAVPHGVGPRCRVRSYLAPKSDRAFVDALERRVKREADVLLHLGDHPDILALEQLDPKGPLGPAIVFRGFPGKTLEAFLEENRGEDGRSALTIDDKLAILRRVADALAFCHRADVVHGALSPEAVLVFRAPPHRTTSPAASERGPLEVKLTRFALARSGDPTSEGTRLFTRLAGASASLYEAPEVTRGSPATAASDLFSLGALAYFLLAEDPPASTTVELAQRLTRDAGLVISAVRDDLFPAGACESLDAVLLAATFVDPSERIRELPTPLDFVDRLEEALTTPETITPQAAAAPETQAIELDPLDAAKNDRLGDLVVLGDLGSGATARVFKVAHPREGEVALKVPLSDAHDERIGSEAEVLEKLRRTAGVDRIAHFIERRTIAGRTCLLVQLAGDRTLADELRAEGALSLDYARRWGDDLLTALRSLEEAGVQHRDIKPANIGLTSGAEKGKKRLLLFDFSLSSRLPSDLGVGTPAYKDPELVQRGRWDDAADRWAAAITLHEMFTGVRPSPLPAAKPGGMAARIEADRIDADVRDGLVRFFERALRFSASERFPTAEDMRDEFIRALHKVPEHDGRAVEEPRFELDALKGLGPEARVGDLPLSTRQRNALDRMGIYTLHDLAQLSSNRIGGVRGVGAKTARSLVELADTVRKHLEISATEAPTPFLRGFCGARRHVEEEAEAGRLSRPLALRFVEAGIVDSVAVASAPQAQVANLVKQARKDGAREAVKDVTAWLEGLLDAARPPSTLGAAVELLAPSGGAKGGASKKRVRQYLGLEDLEGFPRHGSMFELARASGITRAAVSIDIGKARERWLGLPSAAGGAPSKRRELAVLERVFSALDAALAANASVLPLDRAAAAVMEVLPPEPDLSADASRRDAEALVRAVTALDAHLLGGREGARLELRRASHGDPAPFLVAWDRAGFALAERLGREADALVSGGNVIAEAAAAARLREVLGRATELSPRLIELAAALPDRSLVALAAATATEAKISARGELYPAGLPAERALVLSAAALAGRVPVSELERRVRARYPDGARLPEEPAALERLAATLGLRLVDGSLVPNERTLGLGSTELGSLSSAGTSAPAAPAAVAAPAPASPPAKRRASQPILPERPKGDMLGATAFRVFDEELERAAGDGAFRVLLWRGEVADAGYRGAPNAERVASAIARRLKGVVHPLDSALITAAELVAAEKKLRGGLAPALEADALGPEGPAWARLVDLMRRASSQMATSLLASPRPRVLVRLGLLGRYDLLSTIADLALSHRAPAPSEGRAATLVVLPVFAGEGAVVEVSADVAERVGAAAGTRLVPIPGLLPHEILEVPAAWVAQKAERRPSSQPPASLG